MLGILDWGIGGFGLYRLLKERVPDADVVYLSDTGSPPYGTLSRNELADQVSRAISALISRGADHVAVACNAASTVLPQLETRPDMLLTGVIEHGIAAVSESGARSVGVIGGRRTIRSGVYNRALSKRGIAVRGRVAQPLSALIEAGDSGSETFRREAEKIVRPLRDCDALLFACTHYPAAVETFRSTLPGMRLIDPVVPMLEFILGSWEIERSSGNDILLTTGDPESMRRGAWPAFGVELGPIEALRSDTNVPK